MNCPICGNKTFPKMGVHDTDNHITYRRLICKHCGSRFWSKEHLVSKEDEDFRYAYKQKDLKYIRGKRT